MSSHTETDSHVVELHVGQGEHAPSSSSSSSSAGRIISPESHHRSSTYNINGNAHAHDDLDLIDDGHDHIYKTKIRRDRAWHSPSEQAIDKLRNDLTHHQHEAIVLLTHALAKSTKSHSSPPPASRSVPLGNPAALGLAGFATTTFILSAYNTTLLSPNSTKMVLPMALWFGGIGQAAAGILEFVAGNTFGATAFVAYGCFWLSFATLDEFGIPEMTNASSTDVHQAVGFYLLVWLIFSFYMFIASLRQSRLLTGVFSTLVVTLILLIAGNFANDINTLKAGGYFGLLCATLAFYGSAAVVINGSFGQVILPLGNYVHK